MNFFLSFLDLIYNMIRFEDTNDFIPSKKRDTIIALVIHGIM